MKCLLTCILATFILSLSTVAFAVEQLAFYPADSMESVVDQQHVSFDPEMSKDGKGALRIYATGPLTVHLYDTGDIDVENARITYQAALRSENLEGQAYLEMWCVFDAMGEYFSRALHAPIAGSTKWRLQETPFFLQVGQNPVNVRLNLVITGPGTVWVDEIRLLRMPLQ